MGVRVRMDGLCGQEMIREIGFTHMRVGDRVNSLLQMAGLCAKLCKVVEQAKAGVAR